MGEQFLQDEECQRCKGPILAEPYRKERFYEENWTYTHQHVWICYCCGYEHAFNSNETILM